MFEVLPLFHPLKGDPVWMQAACQNVDIKDNVANRLSAPIPNTRIFGTDTKMVNPRVIKPTSSTDLFIRLSKIIFMAQTTEYFTFQCLHVPAKAHESSSFFKIYCSIKTRDFFPHATRHMHFLFGC